MVGWHWHSGPFLFHFQFPLYLLIINSASRDHHIYTFFLNPLKFSLFYGYILFPFYVVMMTPTNCRAFMAIHTNSYPFFIVSHTWKEQIFFHIWQIKDGWCVIVIFAHGVLNGAKEVDVASYPIMYSSDFDTALASLIILIYIFLLNVFFFFCILIGSRRRQTIFEAKVAFSEF